MQKRALTIEAALRWAFREELPKQERGGIELGTRINATNRYGVVPLLCDEEPHPDAVCIGEAVKGLNRLDLEKPTDWNPIADLGDLGGYGRAAVEKALASETEIVRGGALRHRTRLEALIVQYAVLGDGERWKAEPTKIAPVLKNGKAKWWVRERRWVNKGNSPDEKLGHWAEAEVSGVDAKGRPRPGSYHKFHLDPDPHLAICARIESQVWRSALDMLREEIGELETIALKPSELPREPWAAGSTVGAERALRLVRPEKATLN
jgi:hypothetical protein